MSHGITKLHSHSGLERELKFPKHTVIVDEMFGDMFKYKKPLKHNERMYYCVPILDFVKNHGVFKSLRE